MNLRKWEYFLRIAELGSLSRVAEKLEISQPALSRQLTALESEVGAPLFFRNGRGLTLTPAGEAFRTRAEAIMDEIARVPEVVKRAANEPSGHLAFGAPPFMGQILTGQVCANFAQTYPGVRLRVRGAHSLQLREAIYFRDLDIGILAGPITDPELQVEQLVREKLFLVGPETSKLRYDRAISVEEVADLPLILTPRPDGLRIIVDNEFARIGRRPTVAIETEYAPIDDLIRRGVGYAILPGCAMSNTPLARFRFAPFAGTEVIWLMARLENVRPSLASVKFKEMVKDTIRQVVEEGRWQGGQLLL